MQVADGVAYLERRTARSRSFLGRCGAPALQHVQQDAASCTASADRARMVGERTLQGARHQSVGLVSAPWETAPRKFGEGARR